MAEITAAIVKALREETGLGMMECKKALAETNGDVEAARGLLRKKGLTTSEAKAGRVTNQGLVSIKATADRTSATMVEVRCETDFCSRNDEFKTMVTEVADMAAAMPAGTLTASDAIVTRVQSTQAKIGENMFFARGIKISAPRVGSYLHHNSKVGVVIGVEGEVTDEVLADICMHIGFADPVGITVDDVPAEIVAKEREFAIEQAIASGKPKEIAEKMVAGKMRKFLEERALVEQLIAREDKYGKKKVQEVLGAAKIVAFARFAI